MLKQYEIIDLREFFKYSMHINTHKGKKNFGKMIRLILFYI